MNSRLERLAGLATVGGSSPGEIGAVLARVREDDSESWVKEFFDLAARLEGEGDEAARRGHTRTATSFLRRATSYFRFVERCADPDAPFFARFGQRRRACFRKLLALEAIPHELTPESEPGSVFGSVFRFGRTAPASGLLVFGALGEQPEDLYLPIARPALERGHSVTIVTHLASSPLPDPRDLERWPGMRFEDTCLVGLQEGAVPVVALGSLPWRAVVFDSPRLGADPAMLEAAARIRSPALILAGEAEPEPDLADAKALHRHLAGEKSIHFFEIELGAGNARQAGNPALGSEILLDWLDDRNREE